MMSRPLTLLLILAAAVSPGCQRKVAEQSRPRPNLFQWQAAFKQADQVELFSILPNYDDTSDRPKFLGYPIVGSSAITDPSEKEMLYQLLEEFIYDEPLVKPQRVQMCKFYPHHALSFTDKTGKHEIAICFNCGQVSTKSNTLPTFRGDVGLSKQAKKELDGMLKNHGIKSAEEFNTSQRNGTPDAIFVRVCQISIRMK